MACPNAELAWLRANFPGLTDELLSATWDRAVEETCTQARCWQEVTLYDLPADQGVVVLVPPANSVVIVDVTRVSLVQGGVEVPVKYVSQSRFEKLRAANRTTEPVWTKLNQDMIELWPTEPVDRQVVAQVAVAPTDGSVPSDLFLLVRRMIEARLQFLLHTHPTWPHADKSTAAFYDRVWACEVMRARVLGPDRYGPRTVVQASREGVPL